MVFNATSNIISVISWSAKKRTIKSYGSAARYFSGIAGLHVFAERYCIQVINKCVDRVIWHWTLLEIKSTHIKIR
jgi:hypothetical protein